MCLNPVGLVHALVAQQLDVFEQEAATIGERDLAWRPSGGQIGGLRQNPRIAQDAPADQHAFDAGSPTRHDRLRLDAVAAAEHRNAERLRDARDELPIRAARVALRRGSAVNGDGGGAGILDHLRQQRRVPLESSHPARILTVTGILTALVIAATTAAACAGSRIRLQPALCLAIFDTGQPMLTSTMSAPMPSTICAALAMVSGSPPKIWIEIGRSSSVYSAYSSVRSIPRTSPSELTISVTTRPQPPWRLTSRRNAVSVMPAIGATANGDGRVTLPIFITTEMRDCSD